MSGIGRCIEPERCAPSSEPTTPHITCFACSRCEYPICDSRSVLLEGVSSGTPSYAFQYSLDCLLDLDNGVPCYSAAETVETTVLVSEALLQMPLPPAARVAALESIVESRKNLLQQRQRTLLRLDGAELAAPAVRDPLPPRSPLASASALPTTVAVRSTVEEGGGGGADEGGVSEQHRTPGLLPSPSGVGRGTLEAGQRPPSSLSWPSPTLHPASASPHRIPAIRRYGDASESRVDLIRVSADIAGLGVEVCEQDRSAVATSIPAVSTPNSTSGVGVGEGTDTASPAQQTTADPSFANVPPDVLRSATAPALPTEWGAPGNLRVEEAYIQVSRSTTSSRAAWFQSYQCGQRVQCPDCHQPLGFLFEPVEESKRAAPPRGDNTDATEPSYARKKNRREAAAGAAQRFIGLELKRIVQREWSLAQFQQRYVKAQRLDTFRSMFPEAEELQSFYSRLVSLRTQTELYNSLLRRHKEQNDVQLALLHSNKERMATYDEKIVTMQHIIDGQRAQLDMQARQIKSQEELMRNHRMKFATQQRQIDVEQLLLSEQSKTIAAQRAQLLLLRKNLQAVLVPDESALLQCADGIDNAKPRCGSEAREENSHGGGDELTSQQRPLALRASAGEVAGAGKDVSLCCRPSGASVVHCECPPGTPPEVPKKCGAVAKTVPPVHLCGVSAAFAPCGSTDTDSTVDFSGT